MKDQEIVGLWEAYQQVHAQPEEVEQLDEGMDMKTFKANRKKNERQAASDDAKERGHVDKFTGKPYGTKEAASRRKDIHTDRYSPERAARHRANVDPDFEGNDERNYPGGKLKNPKKIRKAKTLGELGEGVDLFDTILEYLVAEGYADTNKAALAIMANMSEEWKQSIMEGPGDDQPPLLSSAAARRLGPRPPIDRTPRPATKRGPATGPGSMARPQQPRRQLMAQ